MHYLAREMFKRNPFGHYLFLKKWLFKDVIDKRWEKYGGLKTIHQMIDHKDLLKEYFDKCKYYLVRNDSQFFCHAGFNHKRVITKQKKLTFSINRQLYKTAIKYGKQGLKFKPIFDENNTVNIKEIFIGHSPTKNYLPSFNSNVINVDTGAGNGGKLTLMDVDTKKYVQAKHSSKYYGLCLK